MTENTRNRVEIWIEGIVNPTANISRNLSQPQGLFVGINGDVFIDNGAQNSRVDRWTANGIANGSVMSVNGSCDSLFVDVNETLYCSISALHRVMKISLSNSGGPSSVAAGDGTMGTLPSQLSNPHGIFVDSSRNLYVADYTNDRIQCFPFGLLNATTVAVRAIAGNLTLNGPRAVLLDASGYMFIIDSNNHRILASGPHGFRCIIGCTGTNGSAADQLNQPWSFSFDNRGSLLVVDRGNSRIQKFTVASNSCRKYLQASDYSCARRCHLFCSVTQACRTTGRN